jgi:3-oxoacyl-[acyl-carrier protein] reductase
MSLTEAARAAAVVTGASSGIGAAIAERLANDGHTVVTLQRRPPPNMGAHGRGMIEFVQVDLSEPAAIDAAVASVLARHPVGYLVNNAGANRPGDIESVTAEDLDVVWNLNVKAAIRLIQGFLPSMREAGFGRIVNMSSRAVLGKTQRIAYSSSKSALIGLTRNLSLEVAADGITVNCIAPGPVATALFDNGHPVGSEKRQIVIQSIPVRRLGTLDEVANAAAFFLDDRNGYITGQTLFVCGGVSISGSGGL